MKARILFTRSHLIGSGLIRLTTWSRYSHCDLIVGEFGDRLIGATPIAGVHEYPIEERLAECSAWEIYSADIESDLVEREIRKQIGKPYDYLGVMGIGFHRDWQMDDAWFCSELQAKAFLDAGLPLINPELRLNRVTPEDLLRSSRLNKVANGHK